MNKKTIKRLIIIIIILILIIGGISFIYKNKIFEKNNKVTEKKYTENEDKLTKEKIKKMYNQIPILDNTSIEYDNAYQSKRVTKDIIDNRLLLAIAFRNVEKDINDKDKIGWCPDDSNEYKGCTNTDWYSFPSKILQNKIKELYDTNVQDESFEISGGVGCKYFNSRYYYSYGGGSLSNIYNIRQYDNISYNQDFIYITDLYLYIEEGILTANEKDTTASTRQLAIYDTSDKKI